MLRSANGFDLSAASPDPRGRAAAAPAFVCVQWLAAALLLALWTLALSLPYRGLRGADDGFYIEVAHLWLSGAPPYASAFDIKPPGYFALLALAEALLGPTQAALNALTLACETGTALCLLQLGRQMGRAEVGLFAAVGYPLLSRLLAANPAYPPLAFATTAAFMFATAPLAWRWRVGWSGLALGLAISIKQTAVLEGAALFWLLLRDPEAQSRRLRSALVFGAAVLAAPAALMAALAAQGALAAMIQDAVVAALRRPQLEHETLGEIARHFWLVQKKVLPLVVLAGAGLLRARALAPRAPASWPQALVLWLLASWLELWLQHARWVIYLGPTLAPLLLTSGTATAALIASPRLRLGALAGLLLLQTAQAYPFRMWRFLGPDDPQAIDAAAQAIGARQPGTSDRLLAIQQGEQLNYVMQLPPPTAYFYWMHLICPFPGAGPDRLREALDAQPRFLVAPVQPFRPYCEDARAWPMIEAALARDYRLVAKVPATSPRLRVYERASEAR